MRFGRELRSRTHDKRVDLRIADRFELRRRLLRARLWRALHGIGNAVNSRSESTQARLDADADLADRRLI